MSAPTPSAPPSGPARPQRLAILISGRGSNMHALVEACEREAWPAEIVGVISNRPEAAGLAWAAARGLPGFALDHKAAPSREAFDAQLAETLDALRPDWVLLAGYMRILTPGFVARFAGRMLNIHPSLLPAYPGLYTHRRAVEDGVVWAGCTVHEVTAELDHGPLLGQAAVPLRPDDDEERLAARVLRAEHRLYPGLVGRLLRGGLERVAQADGRVHYRARDGAPRGFVLDEA